MSEALPLHRTLLTATVVLGIWAIVFVALRRNVPTHAPVTAHASLLHYPKAVTRISAGEVVFRVLDDGVTVTATTERNGELWRVNVLSECLPAVNSMGGLVGAPVVRHMRHDSQKGVLFVVFGKHSFAELKLQTGAVTYLGSD
jgi:hypothetical protein